MKDLVFITGNKHKAEYLARYLGYPVDHIPLDLDEIQSLDLNEIVRHKVRQAYEKVKRPVLVEDVSLEFKALNRLPGTFIRWFIDELSLEGLCSLLDGKDRSARASCVFGYFDGVEEKYFEGSLEGTITEKPAGTHGYGWDPIFIPEGYTNTRAELGEEDDKITYLKVKPFDQIKTFLESHT
jgi:non-canonical purine NTP pyrophosphatase (RdgB/HAM1 family)